MLTYDPSYPLASAHGTHIAGTIAGIARETNVDIQIMPLQVFDNKGQAFTSDIISAIEFASDNGALIVNMSIGTTEVNPALYEAISNAEGMLAVCSAGNNRRDLDALPCYPASYRLPNVISVASVNADDGFSYFSNYSANLVDIAAPGRDIISALPENGTGLMTGTSMAAAYITGVAASLGQISATDLKDRIILSADMLSNLDGKTVDGRRVNLENVLAGVNGSYLTLKPIDDFDVHGYQPTEEERWELFASAGGVLQFDGGERHSVALMVNGTVFAWGANDFYQTGDGESTTTNRLTPVQVTGLTDIVKVAAGYNHTLALKSDGTVVSWGRNNFGQLGDGTTIDSYIPNSVYGLTDVVDIAAGEYHSLALLGNENLPSNGKVMAWGLNSLGQLGDGTTISRIYPVSVSYSTNMPNATSISTGTYHSLALTANQTVWGWGLNASGQLGDGIFSTSRSTPVAVANLTDVTVISAGGNHNLAVREANSVTSIWAWGSNANGQLGNGTTNGSNIPIQQSGSINLSKKTPISAGRNHSFILLANGTMYLWGHNQYGQLGTKNFTDSSVPVQPFIMYDMDEIFAGVNHNLAFRESYIYGSIGNVWAWGNNSNGQLGTGGTTNSNQPMVFIGLPVVTPSPTPTPSFQISAQINKVISGIPGTVSFAIESVGLANGIYAYTLNNAPNGVSAGSIVINNNEGIMSLNYSASIAVGLHKFSVTLATYGIISNTIVFTVSQQKTFINNYLAGDYVSIPFILSDADSFGLLEFTVEYDPIEFELINACELSDVLVLSIGMVINTNVAITAIDTVNGRLSFTYLKNIISGATWSGIVNIVRLKAKKAGLLEINYLLKYK